MQREQKSALIRREAMDPFLGRAVAPRSLAACADWRQLCVKNPQTAEVRNMAFPDIDRRAERLRNLPRTGLRLTLVGLGDVGGTLLTALKLLGDEIAEIGVYDPYEPLIERYVLELGQVLGRSTPRVVAKSPQMLFDCDLFLFTASRGVPPVGQTGDVRMAQFAANREMLKHYAKMARQARFSGLFCQISDPVDLLARCVYLQSNRDEQGNYDWKGLLPEQIVGLGLGVMAARAAYYGEQYGLDPAKIAVFGPHGAGLVAANDCLDYRQEESMALTARTVAANHAVRELGFKPYIAPALSSACLSILALLRGEPFYGAIPMGGVYFGCRAVWTELGPVPVYRPLHPQLQSRIAAAWSELAAFEPQCRL